MAIVESVHHLVFLDDQDRAWCKCGSRRGKERLARHASRTQVVSTMENREDRLLIPPRLHRNFHLPFLDIEHFLPSVALGTDGLTLAK